LIDSSKFLSTIFAGSPALAMIGARQASIADGRNWTGVALERSASVQVWGGSVERLATVSPLFQSSRPPGLKRRRRSYRMRHGVCVLILHYDMLSSGDCHPGSGFDSRMTCG
jgi:hypothetical protein